LLNLCFQLIFHSSFSLFQFWAAYVPCEAQYKDAVQITLEQIDVIERLTDRYSPHLVKCTSSYGKHFKIHFQFGMCMHSCVCVGVGA
jgi:hypothetical protein